MGEQRQALRIGMELPASFEIDDGKEENLAIATTLNISAGGLCINTKQILSVGQKLLLRVGLMDLLSTDQKEKVNKKSGAVALKVQVVWVKSFDVLVVEEYKVGIRLLDSHGEDAQKFVKFCEQIAAQCFVISAPKSSS